MNKQTSRLLKKLFLVSLLAASLTTAFSQPAKPALSGNPIFPGWYADPDSAIFGKEYWNRHPLGETDPNHRVTCIDRMYFDGNGLIKPVKITKEGVEKNALE